MASLPALSEVKGSDHERGRNPLTLNQSKGERMMQAKLQSA
jgi:hypothetical protein